MQFHFEQLTVWQEAIELVTVIYEVTKPFPQDELFGITRQMRRAAVSIPANIAEGKGRYNKKEFVQFLYTARGSLYEVVTLLKLAAKLKYLSEEQHRQFVPLVEVILSKLSGLINSLKQ